MSIWDSFKKFTQPYADDDDYDEYEDDMGTGDYGDEDADTADSQYAPSSKGDTRESGDYDFDVDAAFSSPSARTSTAAASPSGFSGQVVNGGGSSGKQQVVLFRPVSFNDTPKAMDDLRSKKAIIVNMENVDKALARRIVDILSGCVYAIDGSVKKVGQAIYLFCPYNFEVSGDLENLQSEVESYV